MNIIIEKQVYIQGEHIQNVNVNILHHDIRLAIEQIHPGTETVYLVGFGPAYIFVYTGGKLPNTYARITIEI